MSRAFLAVLAAAACLGASAADATTVLWSQAYYGGSMTLASQYDPLTYGNFATTYDNFTLTTAATLSDVSFTGGYFALNGNTNAPLPLVFSPVSRFDLTFYANTNGAPGAAIQSFVVSDAAASETFLKLVNSVQMETYDISTPISLAQGAYWISIVPTLDYPPQWGWALATNGGSDAVQQSFGAVSVLNDNLAFTIDGVAAAPEPATWATLLVGFTGLVLLRRGKTRIAQSRAPAGAA